MKTRDVLLIGMMSAILITVQVMLSFIPNVELVSVLLIAYTLTFGYKTLFIIYIFAALEGFIYGFSIWTINYLYIWTILFFIANLFKRHRSPLIWAAISGFFGLGFGALSALTTLVLSGPTAAVAYWIAGIPFDLVHGVSNFIVALVLIRPLHYLLERLYRRTEDHPPIA